MNIKLHYDVPGDDFTRAGEASGAGASGAGEASGADESSGFAASEEEAER